MTKHDIKHCGKTFCVWCGDYTTYNVDYKHRFINIRGKAVYVLELAAYCDICNSEVYVPEINDVNAAIRETEYMKVKENKND